jgi:hypothetical protein
MRDLDPDAVSGHLLSRSDDVPYSSTAPFDADWTSLE